MQGNKKAAFLFPSRVCLFLFQMCLLSRLLREAC